MKETIRIVFICDEEYVLCTGVALSSLYQSRNPLRNYHVFIIADHISKESEAMFLALTQQEFVIELIHIDDEQKHKSFSRARSAPHVSTAALVKFDLPLLLQGIDQVLYLDGDVLIRDSLEELYDLDIEGKYAAVCKDLAANYFPAPYAERLKIKHAFYFNSGVMLLNLKLLREKDISQKLLHYRQNGVNDFMDQDAFNVVFEENVVYFPFLYNMLYSCWSTSSLRSLRAYYSLDLPSIESFYTSAKIIHFSTPKKPWNYHNLIGSEEWFLRFLDSPFRKIEHERGRYEREIEDNACKYKTILASLRPRQPVEKPQISVIIPVYNAEQYLINCIESLLSQTFSSFEAIFVDDGSTDASLSILQKYAGMDGRVRIYTQKNQFAGIARNNGLSHAAGKYVTFLDSDDLMLPDSLEGFYQAAERTNADIVVSAAYQFCDDLHERSIAPWALREDYLPLASTFSIKNSARYLLQITGGAPWGKLYRLDFLNRHQLRFPPLPRGEDFHFVYLALALASKISTLSAPTILYRTGNGQTSLEGAKDNFPLAPVEGTLLLYDKLLELGLYAQLRQSFLNNLLTRILYNFKGFHTGSALQAFYSATKDVLFPLYGDDLLNPAFYYDNLKFAELEEISNSASCLDYVFAKYKATEKALDAAEEQHTAGSVKHKGLSAAQISMTKPYAIRKFNGAVKCYQDHGMRYSINRLFKKIKKRLDRIFRSK